MFQTFQNAWKLPDLRKKIIFTLMVLLLFRIGSVIPVPFVDSAALSELFSTDSESLLAYFNTLSGDAFSKATIFALSISPYITSSIIMQLLTIAIPALEKLQKSGPDGQKKIATITRYVTIGLAAVMAIGYYITIKSYNVLFNEGIGAAIVIVISFIAGSAIIMWLAEKINDMGIGNGISVILFASIVSRGPTMLINSIANINSGSLKWWLFALTVLVMGIIIIFVVFMTNAERRLPVQYAKKVVGRKMYGGMSTHLPIKLNMSGVMPIIFANAIVALPATLKLIFPPSSDTTLWAKFINAFSSTKPIYSILLFVLIIAFSYFYLLISFNPVEVANNLQKNGGTILGYRPGLPTANYIRKVLNRITLIGAFFLGIIAVFPAVLAAINPSLSYIAFGGSSLLIVVGVAIETTRDLESQITMRHYKGFLD